MHISIVGAGYVGLVTAACLAHVGHHVVCLDVDAARVERLRGGDLPGKSNDLQSRRSGKFFSGTPKFHLISKSIYTRIPSI